MTQLPLLRRVCLRRPPSPSSSSSTSLSVVVQGGGKSRRNFNTSNVGEKEVSKVNLYKVAQELRFASSTSRYAGLSYLGDYPR